MDPRCLEPCKDIQNDLLTPDEVADMLGVSTWTLQAWRRGKHPRNALSYERVGGRILYFRQNVIAFAAGRRMVQLKPASSTMERAA